MWSLGPPTRGGATVATAQMRCARANRLQKAGDRAFFSRSSSSSSVPISVNVYLFILRTVEVCIGDGSAEALLVGGQ